MTFDAERKHILHAVQQAARLTRRVRETLVVAAEKAGREPVTIADFGSQAILCRAIRQHFPDDAVLAEESANDFMTAVAPEQQTQVVDFLQDILDETITQAMICDWLDHGHGRVARRTWVIDPIDGTKGFLAGRGYTIAVGLLVDGKPAFGVLGCPAYPFSGGANGMIYYGDQTDGVQALYLDHVDKGAITVRVSQQHDPAHVCGVESVESGHADHGALSKVRQALGASDDNTVRMDGQDKYAAVACGDADYYVRLSPDINRRERAWDHAAGATLVQAAGGTVSDLDGVPLDFSTGAQMERNRGIIASNGAFHDKLVAAVKATFAGGK